MLIRFWKGIGIMRRNLFWLSDEQWRRIEPYLPRDVRGVERVDDRRVISGIVHVLKSGCRWCDANDDLQPFRALGTARHLEKPVPGACREGSICERADDRFHAY